MPKYVDGYVLPIQKKKVDAYRRMAKDAGKVWRKYGALDYKECVGDDIRPKGMPYGMKSLFPKMVKLKPGETVVFSFIVFRSRAHRDRVNAKVMQDPFNKKYEGKPMPFDMKRMAYAGFKVLVDAR